MSSWLTSLGYQILARSEIQKGSVQSHDMIRSSSCSLPSSAFLRLSAYYCSWLLSHSGLPDFCLLQAADPESNFHCPRVCLSRVLMHAPSPSDDRLSCLIDSLIAGFEELLTCVRAQVANEKLLRERIEFAANEVSAFALLSLPTLSFSMMRIF